MSKTPSLAVLAALALFAAPAYAQEAPAETPAAEAADAATATPDAQAADTATDATDAPEATPDEEATDAATADEAATDDTATDTPPPAAAATDGEPPLGSYYLLSEHQDWTIRCLRTGQPKDPCEMYKLLVDDEDNAVAEMTLIPLTNGEVVAGATLIAPLETDLLEGLGLQINGGEMRGYPFSVCTQLGCMSRMGFTATELATMKRGARATVQLLPFGADPANPIQLTASLSGFTAAFDELSAYVAAPVEEQDDAATETAPEAEEAEAPAE